MSVSGDFFQFTGGELISIAHAIPAPLTVADSWLVLDGSVRELNRHFQRFMTSTTGLEQDYLLDFFDRVANQVPKMGAWFPRIEFRDQLPPGEQLFLRLRQAPTRTLHCTLWSLDELDPRQNSSVKGPDLSVCQKLRRQANLHGADEAVILSEDGYVADGALSAIVWWRDGKLFAPDDTVAWLPSITREIVFELANQAGFETDTERAKPEDLAHCEIWSLSALQGIRGVTNWQQIPVGEHKMLSSFRKRLSMLSTDASNDGPLIA
ncbi:MAG: aminotransferase class IV [Aquiluna sp.]|nr:aminotransferase class IV [Aquiluna sp.]